MPLDQLLQPILVLFVLVVTGFLISRAGLIDQAFRDGLSRLVVDITLPLLILTSLMKLDLTPEILRGSILVLLLSFFSLSVLFFTGWLAAKILGMALPQARVHALQTMLGNVVFIGYPLMNELFPGGEGLLYASLYHLATNTTMWTAGVYLLSREQGNGLRQRLLKLFNPNTLALLAGFMLMSFDVPLPALIDASLGGLGRTTLFLSMIFVGSLLSSYSRPKVFSRSSAWVLFFTKMLLIPVALFFIFRPLSAAGWMNQTALSVLVMQSAMPCMAMFVIIARRYRADENLAMDNVLLSSLLSLVSLPLIYYFLQVLGA